MTQRQARWLVEIMPVRFSNFLPFAWWINVMLTAFPTVKEMTNE